MKLWERYYTPATLEDASRLLDQYDGQARIIAGGTDLLVEMKNGQHDPYPALIDITRIPELIQITQQGQEIIIGAGVTHTQLVKHPLLAQQATCLVESCGVIGGPQVRNVATLGGNVAHALPAADGTTALMALGAWAEYYNGQERARVPFNQLFVGVGKSLLRQGRDVLVRVGFTPQTGEGTAFSRIMRPQGVALPILGCAVWVQLDETGDYYNDVRVCIAPLGPTPALAMSVQNAMLGQPINDSTLASAIEAAWDTLQPRTSKYRATADYRREMVEVLLNRTLPKATQRAKTGHATPEGVGL